MEEIIQANTNHLHELTRLAIALWPGNDFEDLKEELAEFIDLDQNKILLYT